jgi:hypothetical protein
MYELYANVVCLSAQSAAHLAEPVSTAITVHYDSFSDSIVGWVHAAVETDTSAKRLAVRPAAMMISSFAAPRRHMLQFISSFSTSSAFALALQLVTAFVQTHDLSCRLCTAHAYAFRVAHRRLLHRTSQKLHHAQCYI